MFVVGVDDRGFVTGASAQQKPTCVMQSWRLFLEPGPQSFERLDDLKIEHDNVAQIIWGPLKGPFGKVFSFARVNSDGCALAVVSFASYEFASKAFAAEGKAGPDGRAYHIDFYKPGFQALLGVCPSKPSLSDARKIALIVLSGASIDEIKNHVSKLGCES